MDLNNRKIEKSSTLLFQCEYFLSSVTVHIISIAIVLWYVVNQQIFLILKKMKIKYNLYNGWTVIKKMTTFVDIAGILRYFQIA